MQKIRPGIALAILGSVLFFVMVSLRLQVERAAYDIAVSESPLIFAKPPGKIMYYDQAYGFQVVLDSAWKDYRVVKKPDLVFPTVAHLYFEVPINDKQYGDQSGYVSPFAITVYPQSVWKKVAQDDGPPEQKLGENAQYVFTTAAWQDVPVELQDVDFKLQETFQSFVLKADAQ